MEASKKLEWIKEQISAGRAVYLSTYTKATMIKAKHLPQVRVRDGHLEVQHGKAWLNHDYSKITAQ
jgi:hypothetical protein